MQQLQNDVELYGVVLSDVYMHPWVIINCEEMLWWGRYVELCDTADMCQELWDEDMI